MLTIFMFLLNWQRKLVFVKKLPLSDVTTKKVILEWKFSHTKVILFDFQILLVDTLELRAVEMRKILIFSPHIGMLPTRLKKVEIVLRCSISFDPSHEMDHLKKIVNYELPSASLIRKILEHVIH